MNIATIYYSAILGRLKNTSLPLLSSLRKVKLKLRNIRVFPKLPRRNIIISRTRSDVCRMGLQHEMKILLEEI